MILGNTFTVIVTFGMAKPTDVKIVGLVPPNIMTWVYVCGTYCISMVSGVCFDVCFGGREQ
jgi:hypothetical protein